MLADISLLLPINSKQLINKIEKIQLKSVPNESLLYFLKKAAGQGLISIKDVSINNEMGYEVIQVERTGITSLFNDMLVSDKEIKIEDSLKRKFDSFDDESGTSKINKNSIDKKHNIKDSSNNTDIMSLLSMPSTREKQNKQVGEEILELLSKPTAKERSLAEKFKSQGGAQVLKFCPHGTRGDCLRVRAQQITEENLITAELEKTIEISIIKKEPDDTIIIEDDEIIQNISKNCDKLHFKKIIQSHTDESLGDCSFLNTCFHMDTCKYVHYEVDMYMGNSSNSKTDTGKTTRSMTIAKRSTDSGATLFAPQWIQCDLRYLDMSILGKFAVIMADPPWDIHMELPYGTMSDDEMRQLGVPALQDDGLIFLWVTGRAMELGRECLKLWGYDRVDEIIWVKTNQLQRIIRTGRTGHWLNHGKEHCLVGMKGNPPNLNRGLDCDVIVAEVRATSHKPDEIYGIIERLSPGTMKIELFGRPHNSQPNW